jgi:hypothetical protein
MNGDKKSTQILARTFFNQLVEAGFKPNQIIDVSSELIDLVTREIKDAPKPEAVIPPHQAIAAAQEWRESA